MNARAAFLRDSGGSYKCHDLLTYLGLLTYLLTYLQVVPTVLVCTFQRNVRLLVRLNRFYVKVIIRQTGMTVKVSTHWNVVDDVALTGNYSDVVRCHKS